MQRSWPGAVVVVVAATIVLSCGQMGSAQKPPAGAPKATQNKPDRSKPADRKAGDPQAQDPETTKPAAEEGADPDKLKKFELYPYATDVEEVVVIGQRPYRTPLTYGGSRSVISPTRMERSGTSLIGEVLRRTPSFHIFAETGTNSKPNYAIRGLNPERSIDLSILADGIPLAPAPYGYPGMSIHAFSLPRIHAIDVIRSGYTVRYGPNNVAGLVNYLTRPIPEKTTVGQTLRTGSFNEFSSYSYAGGQYGPVGVLLENVYDSGQTFRDHGDYEIKNYAAKLSFQPADNVQILVQAEGFDDHSQMAAGLSVAAYEQDRNQSQGRQDHFRAFQDRLNTRIYWDLNEQARFELLAYWYTTKRVFYIGRPIQYGGTPQQFDKNPDETTVWAIQPQFAFEEELAGMKHHWVVGFRHLEERINYQRLRMDPWPTAPYVYRNHKRAHYDTWSIFAEDRIDVTDRLSVVPGVRVECVSSDIDDLIENTRNGENWLEFLPALSASYRVLDDVAVYVAAQNSFRAPAVYNFSTRPGVPQSIHPEKAWSYELGTRGTLVDDAVYFDADVFYLDFDDRIVKDSTRPEGYVNQGHVVHQGFELAFNADLGKLTDDLEGVSVDCAFNVVEAMIRSGEDKGRHSANAPPYKFNWGLTYRHPTGVWGRVDGLWLSRSYSDNANTRVATPDGYYGIQPAYTLWNVRVGYDVMLWKDRVKLALQTGINNMLNEDYFYRRNGKGILPGIPRHYYGSLAVEVTF